MTMTDITNHMVASAPANGFAGKDYNIVATDAKLLAINLLESNFKITPELYSRQKDWKLGYGRKFVSCGYSEDDNNVVAIIHYFVTAKIGKRNALQCTADFSIIYNTPVGAKQEAAEAFCCNVGTFAAYPYFRALFAQLSHNAGVNLPPLPVIASTAHIPPKKN